MYRSPLGPPLVPCSPSPESLMREPESTPPGILTRIFLFCFNRVLPRHVGQTFRIVLPLPLQAAQVVATLKKPCWILCCPDPPQLEQISMSSWDFAPSPPHVLQDSRRGMSISFEDPNAASSKLISRLYWRSEPRSPRCPLRSPAASKNYPKMSPKMSPKPLP